MAKCEYRKMIIRYQHDYVTGVVTLEEDNHAISVIYRDQRVAQMALIL